MTTRSLDLDGETTDLAGSCAVSPQARRAGQASNVIPFPVRLSAAAFEPDWDDLGADDYFESIGTLTVTLVGQWSLPRILVWGAPDAGEEEQHREL